MEVDVISIILKRIDILMKSEVPKDRKELHLLCETARRIMENSSEERITEREKGEIYIAMEEHLAFRMNEIVDKDLREPDCMLHELACIASTIDGLQYLIKKTCE